MQNQSELELDQLAEELTLQRLVNESGTVCYYNKQDQFHRVYGPAVIFSDGTKYWHQNNKHHRLDGPSIIYHDGTRRWYINGVQYNRMWFNIHPLVVQHKIKTVLQRINAALRSKYISRDRVK